MTLERLTQITSVGITSGITLNNATLTGVTTITSLDSVSVGGTITAVDGNFSGNITAVGATFSGNVSIAGTLTYEDVTNIDSVGIITAQSGINVTGGVTVGTGATLDGSTNTIIASTNGSERLRIDSNGLLRHGVISGGTYNGNISFAYNDRYPSIEYRTGGTIDGRVWKDVNSGYFLLENVTNGFIFEASNSEALRINSSGNIGINTDNPTKQITVGAAITTGLFQVSPHISGWDIAVTSGNLAPHYQTDFSLYTGQIGAGTKRFGVDSSGRVTMPYQPAFYAYKNDDGTQVGSGDYIFNDVVTNRGSHYSTTNGRFTAPVAGAYFFSCAIQLFGSTSGGGHVSFRVNGVDFMGSQNSSNPVYDEIAGAHDNIYFSAVITLAADEYVTVWRSFTTRGMQSYFTGYLIG